MSKSRIQYRLNELLVECFIKSVCTRCSVSSGSCKKLMAINDCLDELLNYNETLKEVSSLDIKKQKVG